MRILVLGGTAFLSAETARQALAAGHDVTCLARGTASAPPDGATWLRADRSEGAAAYAAASEAADSGGGWDAVVDVSRDPGQAREALEALAGSARHWTFVSSCSVYADHSVAGADEDAGVLAPLAPGTELSAGNYGEAKAAIEHWTAELAGDRAHICRAGLIGGPGDGSDRYGYWPARFARDADPVLVPDIPTDATQIIDVRDLAAWILTAAENGTTGALNAVGEPVPFAAYLEESRRLAEIFRRGGRRPGGLAGVPRGELLGRSGLAAIVAAAGPRRLRDPQQRRGPGRRSDAPGPGRTRCGTPWRMSAAADSAANARPG